jgi:hypothetical protein
MPARIRRTAWMLGVFAFVSMPVAAQESPKSEKPQNPGTDALAQIEIRQQPAYKVSCRASGDLRKEARDHSLPGAASFLREAGVREGYPDG